MVLVDDAYRRDDAVGAITGTIPSGATAGQTYTVTITGASATYLSNLVTVNPGAGATLTVAITYKVGDVYPYTSDIAPNFGDGVLNILDLIQELFAVNNISAASNRRYVRTALTAWISSRRTPPLSRGGDGVLDIRDLILELFRVNNLDPARPLRVSMGGALPWAACATAGSSGSSISPTEVSRRSAGGSPKASGRRSMRAGAGASPEQSSTTGERGSSLPGSARPKAF